MDEYRYGLIKEVLKSIKENIKEIDEALLKLEAIKYDLDVLDRLIKEIRDET